MIAIIGAGPAGCYAACKLAEKGHDVKVFEKRDKIGGPVQCTGLLTGHAAKLVDIDEDVIVNRISKVRLRAPNGQSLDVNFGIKNIVVDRAGFDRMMAEKAVSAGAEILFRHKFSSIIKGKAVVGNKALKYDWLIGADGPQSMVAKAANLFSNRRFITGCQARVETIVDEPEMMEAYLGTGCFSWFVPESGKIGRLGVAAHEGASKLLQALVKEKKCKVLQYQGGLIPLYNPKQRLGKDNVLLLGDAATQVKATTFGGIVPGLMAAETLAKDIARYEKNCRKTLWKDLWLGLKMRQALDKFSLDDYNELVSMFSSGKAKDIIEQHDRDFPSKFVLKLLLAKPKLLKYGIKAFA